jgi:hypothetical protein
MCGFPVGELRKSLITMCVVIAGFLVATLEYYRLVWFMKLSPLASVARPTIVYILAGVAVLDAALVLFRWPIPASLPPKEARTRLLIQLALAESVVIYGLIAYFVTRTHQYFVMFLIGGLVLFLVVIARLPRMRTAIRRHLYDQWQESKRE